MKSLFFLFVSLIFLSISDRSSHASDRTLVFAMQDLPEMHDYASTSLFSDYILMRNVTEGLFSTDVNGNLIAGQVSRYEVSDDGLVYTFYLRDDIFWSNGRKVVAEDFVRAWRRLLDPKYNNYINLAHLKALVNYDEVVSGLQPPQDIGVSTVSEKILSVKLKGPMSFFTKTLVMPQLAPVPSFMSDDELDQMFSGAQTLLSNGPYQVFSVSGSEVVVKKNSHYWDKERVFFDKIRFRKSKTVRSAVVSVVTGDSDIAELKDRDELRWIKENYSGFLKEFSRYATEYYVINLDEGWLGKNPKLREALSMSIDRKRIVRSIVQSGVPAYNLVPSSMYQEKRQSLPAWLDIGYPKRVIKAHGIIEEYKVRSGTSLNITLKIKDEPQTYKVAYAVKTMWEAIGLGVNIEKMNVREVYESIDKGNYQVARAGWGADYNDPYNFLFLYGKEKEFLGDSKSLDNIDDLLGRSLSEMKQERRESLYVEIEDLNHKRTRFIPLYHYGESFVLNPKLHGVSSLATDYLLKWAYRSR